LQQQPTAAAAAIASSPHRFDIKLC